MPARCRMMNGLRENGTIFDLSPNGCSITLHSLRPVVGMRLVLKSTGLEGISGIIRWAKEHSCGIEFDSTLYEPVVEHLCRQFVQEPSEER
jgi:hypothetical protein